MNCPMTLPVLSNAIRMLIAFGLAANAAAAREYAPFPPPDRGYITDLADLLSAAQEDRLESWLYTAEKTGGIEIAVVTIGSIQDYPQAPQDSIESFAAGLFNRYGIGNLPDNKGVLLLVAVRDREARIELGAGFGRSRDADADRIMQSKIIPSFQKGDYAGGIQSGVRGILAEFGGIRMIPGWIKWAVLGAILFLLPVMISLFRRGKRGWGWIAAGIFIVLLLGLLVLIRRTAESLPARSGSGGHGGGFGGGFSGGGGATGRW